MEEDLISPWWISLFLFGLFAGGFAVLGLLHGAWKYVRFGVGFGIAFALFPVWIVPLLDVVSEWSGLAVLFGAVPVMLFSVGFYCLFSFWVGSLFYGSRQWDADGKKELADKAEVLEKAGLKPAPAIPVLVTPRGVLQMIRKASTDADKEREEKARTGDQT